jgi:Ras-related protein Rab-8A
VTDEKSFANVDYWLNRIQENGDEGVELILIGNKIDMINDVHVDRSSAQKVAEDHSILYFETSAKDSSNLDFAMKTLITNIINNPGLNKKIDANSNVHIGSTKPKPRKNAQNCCR